MEHFSEMAKNWDTQEKIDRNIDYAKCIKQYLPLSASNQKIKILDLGCGTGLLGTQFLDHPDSQIVGVDTSAGMLDVFLHKFHDNNADGYRAKAFLMDMSKTELPEKNFNLIVSAMAFHHIKDTYPMLLKLKERLAPEGIIAIIDLDEEDGTFHPDPKNMGVHHFGFSHEQNMAWANELDLNLVERKIVHAIEKNEKSYPIFLAVYKDKVPGTF